MYSIKQTHMEYPTTLRNVHYKDAVCTTLQYRFSESLWKSVQTSLIVRAASVTTTHCVAGVLWSTSVLEGPSARMQWSQ